MSSKENSLHFPFANLLGDITQRLLKGEITHLEGAAEIDALLETYGNNPMACHQMLLVLTSRMAPETRWMWSWRVLTCLSKTLGPYVPAMTGRNHPQNLTLRHAACQIVWHWLKIVQRSSRGPQDLAGIAVAAVTHDPDLAPYIVLALKEATTLDGYKGELATESLKEVVFNDDIMSRVGQLSMGEPLQSDVWKFRDYATIRAFVTRVEKALGWVRNDPKNDDLFYFHVPTSQGLYMERLGEEQARSLSKVAGSLAAGEFSLERAGIRWDAAIVTGHADAPKGDAWPVDANFVSAWLDVAYDGDKRLFVDSLARVVPNSKVLEAGIRTWISRQVGMPSVEVPPHLEPAVAEPLVRPEKRIAEWVLAARNLGMNVQSMNLMAGFGAPYKPEVLAKEWKQEDNFTTGFVRMWMRMTAVSEDPVHMNQHLQKWVTPEVLKAGLRAHDHYLKRWDVIPDDDWQSHVPALALMLSQGEITLREMAEALTKQDISLIHKPLPNALNAYALCPEAFNSGAFVRAWCRITAYMEVGVCLHTLNEWVDESVWIPEVMTLRTVYRGSDSPYVPGIANTRSCNLAHLATQVRDKVILLSEALEMARDYAQGEWDPPEPYWHHSLGDVGTDFGFILLQLARAAQVKEPQSELALWADPDTFQGTMAKWYRAKNEERDPILAPVETRCLNQLAWIALQVADKKITREQGIDAWAAYDKVMAPPSMPWSPAWNSEAFLNVWVSLVLGQASETPYRVHVETELARLGTQPAAIARVMKNLRNVYDVLGNIPTVKDDLTGKKAESGLSPEEMAQALSEVLDDKNDPPRTAKKPLELITQDFPNMELKEEDPATLHVVHGKYEVMHLTPREQKLLVRLAGQMSGMNTKIPEVMVAWDCLRSTDHEFLTTDRFDVDFALQWIRLTRVIERVEGKKIPIGYLYVIMDGKIVAEAFEIYEKKHAESDHSSLQLVPRLDKSLGITTPDVQFMDISLVSNPDPGCEIQSMAKEILEDEDTRILDLTAAALSAHLDALPVGELSSTLGQIMAKEDQEFFRVLQQATKDGVKKPPNEIDIQIMRRLVARIGTLEANFQSALNTWENNGYGTMGVDHDPQPCFTSTDVANWIRLTRAQSKVAFKDLAMDLRGNGVSEDELGHGIGMFRLKFLTPATLQDEYYLLQAVDGVVRGVWTHEQAHAEWKKARANPMSSKDWGVANKSLGQSRITEEHVEVWCDLAWTQNEVRFNGYASNLVKWTKDSEDAFRDGTAAYRVKNQSQRVLNPVDWFTTPIKRRAPAPMQPNVQHSAWMSYYAACVAAGMMSLDDANLEWNITWDKAFERTLNPPFAHYDTQSFVFHWKALAESQRRVAFDVQGALIKRGIHPNVIKEGLNFYNVWRSHRPDSLHSEAAMEARERRARDTKEYREAGSDLASPPQFSRDFMLPEAPIASRDEGGISLQYPDGPNDGVQTSLESPAIQMSHSNDPLDRTRIQSEENWKKWISTLPSNSWNISFHTDHTEEAHPLPREAGNTDIMSLVTLGLFTAHGRFTPEQALKIWKQTAGITPAEDCKPGMGVSKIEFSGIAAKDYQWFTPEAMAHVLELASTTPEIELDVKDLKDWFPLEHYVLGQELFAAMLPTISKATAPLTTEQRLETLRALAEGVVARRINAEDAREAWNRAEEGTWIHHSIHPGFYGSDFVDEWCKLAFRGRQINAQDLAPLYDHAMPENVLSGLRTYLTRVPNGAHPDVISTMDLGAEALRYKIKDAAYIRKFGLDVAKAADATVQWEVKDVKQEGDRVHMNVVGTALPAPLGQITFDASSLSLPTALTLPKDRWEFTYKTEAVATRQPRGYMQNVDADNLMALACAVAYGFIPMDQAIEHWRRDYPSGLVEYSFKEKVPEGKPLRVHTNQPEVVAAWMELSAHNPDLWSSPTNTLRKWVEKDVIKEGIKIATGVMIGNQRERDESPGADRAREWHVLLALGESVANRTISLEQAREFHKDMAWMAQWEMGGESVSLPMAEKAIHILAAPGTKELISTSFARFMHDYMKTHSLQRVLKSLDPIAMVPELRDAVRGESSTKLFELMNHELKPHEVAAAVINRVITVEQAREYWGEIDDFSHDWSNVKSQFQRLDKASLKTPDFIDKWLTVASNTSDPWIFNQDLLEGHGVNMGEFARGVKYHLHGRENEGKTDDFDWETKWRQLATMVIEVCNGTRDIVDAMDRWASGGAALANIQVSRGQVFPKDFVGTWIRIESASGNGIHLPVLRKLKWVTEKDIDEGITSFLAKSFTVAMQDRVQEELMPQTAAAEPVRPVVLAYAVHKGICNLTDAVKYSVDPASCLKAKRDQWEEEFNTRNGSDALPVTMVDTWLSIASVHPEPHKFTEAIGSYFIEPALHGGIKHHLTPTKSEVGRKGAARLSSIVNAVLGPSKDWNLRKAAIAWTNNSNEVIPDGSALKDDHSEVDFVRKWMALEAVAGSGFHMDELAQRVTVESIEKGCQAYIQGILHPKYHESIPKDPLKANDPGWVEANITWKVSSGEMGKTAARSLWKKPYEYAPAKPLTREVVRGLQFPENFAAEWIKTAMVMDAGKETTSFLASLTDWVDPRYLPMAMRKAMVPEGLFDDNRVGYLASVTQGVLAGRNSVHFAVLEWKDPRVALDPVNGSPVAQVKMDEAPFAKGVDATPFVVEWLRLGVASGNGLHIAELQTLVDAETLRAGCAAFQKMVFTEKLEGAVKDRVPTMVPPMLKQAQEQPQEPSAEAKAPEVKPTESIFGTATVAKAMGAEQADIVYRVMTEAMSPEDAVRQWTSSKRQHSSMTPEKFHKELDQKKAVKTWMSLAARMGENSRFQEFITTWVAASAITEVMSEFCVGKRVLTQDEELHLVSIVDRMEGRDPTSVGKAVDSWFNVDHHVAALAKKVDDVAGPNKRGTDFVEKWFAVAMATGIGIHGRSLVKWARQDAIDQGWGLFTRNLLTASMMRAALNGEGIPKDLFTKGLPMEAVSEETVAETPGLCEATLLGTQGSPGELIARYMKGEPFKAVSENVIRSRDPKELVRSWMGLAAYTPSPGSFLRNLPEWVKPNLLGKAVVSALQSGYQLGDKESLRLAAMVLKFSENVVTFDDGTMDLDPEEMNRLLTRFYSPEEVEIPSYLTEGESHQHTFNVVAAAVWMRVHLALYRGTGAEDLAKWASEGVISSAWKLVSSGMITPTMQQAVTSLAGIAPGFLDSPPRSTWAEQMDRAKERVVIPRHGVDAAKAPVQPATEADLTVEASTVAPQIAHLPKTSGMPAGRIEFIGSMPPREEIPVKAAIPTKEVASSYPLRVVGGFDYKAMAAARLVELNKITPEKAAMLVRDPTMDLEVEEDELTVNDSSMELANAWFLIGMWIQRQEPRPERLMFGKSRDLYNKFMGSMSAWVTQKHAYAGVEHRFKKGEPNSILKTEGMKEVTRIYSGDPAFVRTVKDRVLPLNYIHETMMTAVLQFRGGSNKGIQDSIVRSCLEGFKTGKWVVTSLHRKLDQAVFTPDIAVRWLDLALMVMKEHPKDTEMLRHLLDAMTEWCPMTSVTAAMMANANKYTSVIAAAENARRELVRRAVGELLLNVRAGTISEADAVARWNRSAISNDWSWMTMKIDTAPQDKVVFTKEKGELWQRISNAVDASVGEFTTDRERMYKGYFNETLKYWFPIEIALAVAPIEETHTSEDAEEMVKGAGAGVVGMESSLDSMAKKAFDELGMNRKEVEKKAKLAILLAQGILGSDADTREIEDQALAFMGMDIKAIQDSLVRLNIMPNWPTTDSSAIDEALKVPTTMTLGQKALATIKSDAQDIALRTGVKRVRVAVADKLGSWWTRHSNPQQRGETEGDYRQRLLGLQAHTRAFLSTDAGEAALAMLVGIAWTTGADTVENPHVRAFGNEVAREFRISAGADMLDGVIDEVISPMIASFRDAPDFLGTQIRVVAESQGVVTPADEVVETTVAPEGLKETH